MIAVLSPAKTLNLEPVKTKTTQPRMLEKAEALVSELKTRTAADLQEMMHISEKLAELNRDRYQSFSTPFKKSNAKPAIHTFKGDVYLGLDAETLSEEDVDFAQKHLRMLSGLYGVLRPRDLMQAYRLEMGTKLPNAAGKDLYAFWGDEITERLQKDLRAVKSKVLLNLASQEYFKSVRPAQLKGRVLNIHFKEDRNGQLKVISFNAKKARGSMARLMIQERITDPELLKGLVVDDYVYREGLSSEDDWLFVK
ncbi:MAG: peroxide stress protein YaaA [Bacteroidota bacterium]